MVEAYRKAKIEKMLKKLVSRKSTLEDEIHQYNEGSVPYSIITGQIIELNYIIGDIKIEFKIELDKMKESEKE